jgi:hypothetical protein
MLYQAVKNKISIEDILQGTSGNTTQAQSSTSSLMNLVMQFRKVWELAAGTSYRILGTENVFNLQSIQSCSSERSRN